MKLHRYVDHQRLHIVTKDVISLSISVLLLFRHYISHKITFGAPSSGGVLRSACGAFIQNNIMLLIKLKGITNAATWSQMFYLQTPPILGMGSIGQKSQFSEHGHVCYQITENH